ncbi:MAG: hypothetical protein Dbin4_02947 [Alphaproteobacteria bacterium]|nr:hypothetical protein [Alphaproteobacteria bacterium]
MRLELVRSLAIESTLTGMRIRCAVYGLRLHQFRQYVFSEAHESDARLLSAARLLGVLLQFFPECVALFMNRGDYQANGYAKTGQCGFG